MTKTRKKRAIKAKSLRRETAPTPCFQKTYSLLLPTNITSLRLSNRAVLLNVGATPIVILGLLLLMEVADLHMAKDQTNPVAIRY